MRCYIYTEERRMFKNSFANIRKKKILTFALYVRLTHRLTGYSHQNSVLLLVLTKVLLHNSVISIAPRTLASLSPPF